MDIDCKKCKCWIRPFEPPTGCFSCCTAKILKFAKPDELTSYFEIPEILADRLFEISADDSLFLLIHYRRHLSDEEFDRVYACFENIKEKGWKWIRTTFRQRIEAHDTVLA